MKILVTGSDGFIGRNLCSRLEYIEGYEVLKFDRNHSLEELKEMTRSCDFVFHLAGVNRPKDDKEFEKGNKELTEILLTYLEKNKNIVPLMLSSSIQAELDNSYGQSKKEAEELVKNYSNRHDVEVFIYRYPNLFGKWSKPFYNSVIATWCHQIAHGDEIRVDDENHALHLVYIDDLVDELLRILESNATRTHDNYCSVPVSYYKTLGQISSLILSFKESRHHRFIPNMADDFTRKLYSTYLHYLPKDQFSYPLIMYEDERGSFTEFVKSYSSGQVSVNVSKPGIAKGQHWHHSKNEKFLVVKGKAKIQFRDVFSNEVIDYIVSEEKLEVVDIPTGYTHNIINIGEEDLVTIMWVNEPFDPEKPDTYFKEV